LSYMPGSVGYQPTPPPLLSPPLPHTLPAAMPCPLFVPIIDQTTAFLPIADQTFLQWGGTSLPASVPYSPWSCTNLLTVSAGSGLVSARPRIGPGFGSGLVSGPGFGSGLVSGPGLIAPQQLSPVYFYDNLTWQ